MATRKQPTTKRWYEDAQHTRDVTEGIVQTTREQLLARAGAGHLFPHGITHLKLEIGATLDEGFKAAIDIQGPDGVGQRSYRDEGGTRQLTPTASWWFDRGQAPFIRVISLGATAVQTQPVPSFGWSAYREHWVVAEEIENIVDAVEWADLLVSKNHHDEQNPNTPSEDLKDDAAEVADAAKWRFQTKAKGELDPSAKGDWTAGKPPMGSRTLLYYEEKTTQLTDISPRILFELTADKKNLARITWLTKQPHAGYPIGFTLARQSTLPSSWTSWTGWYHYTIATGL